MTELCENLVDGLLRLGHRLYDVSPSPREIKQKIAALIGYREIETGVPLWLKDWSTFDV
jgi:hypothetical protein